jgi:isoleucyl-tRNA synthetase
MLGNLCNQQDPEHPRFNPETDCVPFDQMPGIDRWALARKEQLVKKCLKGYEDYQFHQVYGALYNFCIVDMSSFYLDILKDRLYTYSTHSQPRRSAQTVLWEILDAFTRLIAPILPFTAEEVYSAMYEGLPPADKADSVHVQLFPEYDDERCDMHLTAEWEKLRELRESVLKALEEVRQAGDIGNSLEAKVRIGCSGDMAAFLRRYEQELRYVFIVSQVAVEENKDVEGGLQIDVFKADGQKCERCWNFSVNVGHDSGYPALCERCIPVVREMH